MTNSILNTVKSGIIDKEYDVFDDELLIWINAELSTLKQVGVGTKGFVVNGPDETWEDFIPDNIEARNLAIGYMKIRVRLRFDPPQNSALIKPLEESAQEYLVRCNYQVDPDTTFDE